MPRKNSSRTGGTLRAGSVAGGCVAVPALVVFVVIGLWWALFSPPEDATAVSTPTRPVGVIGQPHSLNGAGYSGGICADGDHGAAHASARNRCGWRSGRRQRRRKRLRRPLENGGSRAKEPLTIGDTAEVCCTDGSGLRMRADAGTSIQSSRCWRARL